MSGLYGEYSISYVAIFAMSMGFHSLSLTMPALLKNVKMAYKIVWTVFLIFSYYKIEMVNPNIVTFSGGLGVSARACGRVVRGEQRGGWGRSCCHGWRKTTHIIYHTTHEGAAQGRQQTAQENCRVAGGLSMDDGSGGVGIYIRMLEIRA